MKEFKHYQSRWKHEKTCKIMIDNNNNIDKKILSLEQRIQYLENCLHELLHNNKIKNELEI